jgi:hypothetical protein
MRTGQQWITTRMYTAVIASALVLPALVPFFESFRLRSIGLFLTGLFFLLGFGVSYYILLVGFWKWTWPPAHRLRGRTQWWI